MPAPAIPTFANGWQAATRYPDPAIIALDPSFDAYHLKLSAVERLATGCRWSEGPVWFGDGRYLIWSDIPNNRMLKWEEETGAVSVFRKPSNFGNGNTRDRQGRLITCEHSVTRRIVRTEKDGRITVLADKFNGKRLNAPNDIVVKSDDTIWFTDPLFGINGEWEGTRAQKEQDTTNVYRIDKTGKLTAVITDILNPNGLAFSPDEKKLYVVEWRGTPNRSIWSYDVNADGTVANKAKLYDAADFGALDGFRVDKEGNLWVGYGSNGALQEQPSPVGSRNVHQLRGKPEDLDGVLVLNPAGKPIGFIRLPERCANLEFGGPKRNRLYMTSCHSLYALYVESHGAV
jgi:gluconolactonase